MSEKCLQLKTGSCAGCNVATIGIERLRWHGESIQQIQDYLKKEYCPKSGQPSITHLINHDASHAMGQPKTENLDDDRQNIGRP